MNEAVLADAAETARKIIDGWCRMVVDDQTALTVEVAHRAASASIVIRASDSDMGRVIGKGGAVYRALRAVVLSIGARLGANLDLQALRNDIGGSVPRSAPVPFRADWVKQTGEAVFGPENATIDIEGGTVVMIDISVESDLQVQVNRNRCSMIELMRESLVILLCVLGSRHQKVLRIAIAQAEAPEWDFKK